MQLYEYANDKHLPNWVMYSGLEFWEPDRLYIEWLTFLYTIWQRVDYL